MPKLKALRPLHGSYGTVAAGQIFTTSEEVAQSLESRGLVERQFSDAEKLPSPEEVKEQLEKYRKMAKSAPENKDMGAAPENKAPAKGKKK